MTASSEQPIHLEFCGQWQTVAPPGPFHVGREADLSIDENQYLHRAFLELRWDRFWWLTNVGSRLTATVSDDGGAMQAWLAPGATLPLLCRTTEVRFTAGPTGYLLTLALDEAAITLAGGSGADTGSTTLSPAELTMNQRLTVLALAEPALLASAAGSNVVPSSQEAATRLGWTLSKFNRQLDAVCQKLARTGVGGLHGDIARLASGRRARLVEYALAVRLVVPEDLALIDRAADGYLA
ncbi:MAG: hypothetical protein KDA98_07240 [Acidimicrobiales bacterium]|nr:hypothetical protein [Acidimicrobiales bacterium]